MKNRGQYTDYRRFVLFVAVISVCFSCRENVENFRSSIDLSGYWQFSLDSNDSGITQNWFLSKLSDSIQLPGTTDLSQKGHKNSDTTTFHLNRVYTYVGPAWYRREVLIPDGWQDNHIQLVMERTKPSKIWIDGQYAGESLILQSPQKYDLSNYLTPGKHIITVRIDNNPKLTPYGGVHIYSEDTQTNWNGIIGDIYLEASDKTYITDLQVYPDIDNKKINVSIAVSDQRKLDNIDIELQVTKEKNGRSVTLKPAKYTVPCDSVIFLEYTLGEKTDLWDEYVQPLYSLNAIISSKGQFKDNVVVPFGMRKFSAKGTQFAINGRITFLRGKHDACVFPLTGFPPMDTACWMQVFRIAKSFGINHYRFHSWCPPAAAFEAADLLGIYLQPELPFWGGLESDSVAARLMAEGIELLKAYANHPSFVMFAPGNEIWSGHDRVEKIMTALKKADNRPLYAQGSNNNIGYMAPMPYEDFHVAARTPYAHDTILTHTRLTHGYVDSRDGGILNTQLPSTTVNFDYAVSQIKIPLISHEMGQYQIYPDYAEINKYTGVLRAWNFEVFRNRLQKAGMLDQNTDFTKASGAWSVLCYRAEIEAALRTTGLAGFQLLDLQDYPGQGTALVGILDAFMDSKNVVSRQEWDQFCNDVVPLLEYEKYCWTTKETFTASVQVANYSNAGLDNKLKWEVAYSDGNGFMSGTFDNSVIRQGGLNTIGKIEIPLTKLNVPEKLTITLSIANTNYENSYPLWVYPVPFAPIISDEIFVATRLNNDVINKLKEGKKVLLFPDAASIKENSIPGLFPPDFWNYGMFKSISEWAKKPISPGTLGILTNPKHPVFNSFITDSYTNWQWFSIIKNSHPLILNNTSKDYRPIVQVIDNLERNNKLGIIFEFKAGNGKLLVCTANLPAITDKPEACQLYSGIVKYMESDKFAPSEEITFDELKQLLR